MYQDIPIPLDLHNPSAKAGPLATRLADEIMKIQVCFVLSMVGSILSGLSTVKFLMNGLS